MCSITLNRMIIDSELASYISVHTSISQVWTEEVVLHVVGVNYELCKQ